MAGRTVRAPEKTIAVPDHNVPTTLDRAKGIDNEESRIQVEALDKNAKDFGIHYYPVSDVRQGIVHIVGPEQGWTLPGMTVVCGDDSKEIKEHEGRDHRQTSPRCDSQGHYIVRYR